MSQPDQPQASVTSKRRLDDDLFQGGLPSKRARTNEGPSVTPHPETQHQPDEAPVENVERKEEEEEDDISSGQMSKLLIVGTLHRLPVGDMSAECFAPQGDKVSPALFFIRVHVG